MIAILLPCKNEEHSIVKVIHDWQEAIPEAEIFVCDNNSTDNSYELAKSTGVKVFQEFTPGKGAAIKRLLREVKADIYIMCDSDDTYPATRDLLTLVQYGYDLVVGNRLDKNTSTEKVSFIKYLGNKIFSNLCNRKLECRITDPLSGLRAFTKEFIQDLKLSDGFEIEMEMNAYASKGFHVTNLPIDYKARTGDKSKISVFKDGFKILKTLYKLSRQIKPICSIDYVNNQFVDLGACWFKHYIIYTDKSVRCNIDKLGLAPQTFLSKLNDDDFKYITHYRINSKNSLEETWTLYYGHREYIIDSRIKNILSNLKWD